MTISNRKRALSSEYGEKPKIKRSRNGCHNCKRLKIKCDEKKPQCSYCVKTDNKCDYSIKLTWGGRPYKNGTKLNKLSMENETPKFERIKLELNSQQVKENDKIQFVVQGTNLGEINSSSNSEWRNSSSRKNSTVRAKGCLENKTNQNKANPEDFYEKNSKPNGYFEEAELSRAGNLMNVFNSPPAFTTPSGDSILSDFNTFPQQQNFSTFSASPPNQDLTAANNDNYSMSNSNGNVAPKSIVDKTSVKIETPREDNLNSIINSIPEISTGIENLSNEFERISNGGYQLNLKNSEILNNFMLSNMDENSNLTDKVLNTPTQWSPLSDLNIDILDSKTSRPVSRIEMKDELFNNYSEDLAKIEAYLPERQKSNLLNDFLSSLNSSRQFAYNIGSRSSRKIREIEEDENDEESIERLFHDIGIDLNFMNSGDSIDEDNKILTPSELFESIPPLLVPLPEILIEVPFYRNLMHFWVNVASQNLVPAPSYIYSDNPFKVLLPQMAMEYPSILTTLLAFAASIRSLLLGPDNIPKEIVEQLLARSCNELLKLLKDKNEATSDGTLATVLLLSCYESFQSNDFDRHRTHALGARQIVMARKCFLSCESPESDKSSPSSTSSKRSRGKESDIAFFLMRWFIYVDVMGALSATKNSHKYLTSENGHYLPIESVANLTDLNSNSVEVDRKSDIDHLLGFDIRVLPQLTDIALLIRKADSYLEQAGADCSSLPITIITAALEVKESITSAYEVGEARRQAKLDSIIDYKIQRKKESQKTDSPPNLSNIMQQYDILRATNKIFCDMGLLNLYRRVLRVPRESPIIQDLAEGIGLILDLTIESKSSAEICSIFCLFCAACETLDPNMRELFYDRFTKLTEMGNVNAMKSLQIMSRCWDTGEDWIAASKELDIDVALL
ncbi:uncharacterized protein AC631_04848 [Debaryomyces fabryi]|uniref:Zn(2)-C6 fungal-type domain-containing protein n=1 Tax=Debaryomyces fabryi TaxID=58627 RepID=A0A0V1PSZ9_9ASCO|nr:uncharacterized protein AC631_04848 [Debaryomyces fabryi]KRZ99388.1 hypothetical protein AC631_04848 [Debaryomyces fabryi]CUM48617.1 unnamed protein product [Debaryomyces fabryi]